jgi:hypothetical protein
VALAAALVALVAGTGVAGCSDDGAGGDGAGPGAGDKVPAVEGEELRADPGSQGDTCTLLDDDALAPLFPDGVPDPSGTSMGEGFAECEWGRESEGPVVLLSTLPAADFRSDYVEQLDVTAPVDGVEGVEGSAVSFPGFVGIGRGSAGGGSVGFAKGEEAVLVAVRSSGRPTEDADLASDLAAVVAGRL